MLAKQTILPLVDMAVVEEGGVRIAPVVQTAVFEDEEPEEGDDDEEFCCWVFFEEGGEVWHGHARKAMSMSVVAEVFISGVYVGDRY